MSYIGNTKIGKMYLGNTEIAKAYLGNTLVFQNTPPTLIPYIRGGADGSYIDTGITPDNTTKVIVWARNVNPAAGWFFGGRIASKNSQLGLFLPTTNPGAIRCLYYNNTVYDANDQFTNLSGYHKYELYQGVLKVDDVVQASGSTGTFSCPHNLYLFGMNTAGTLASPTLPIDICACQIYKNDVLVRDYTAVNSPSVGLYDAVSDTVFTNAGTGSLTYGSFNPNAYIPLEYIESSGSSYIQTNIQATYSMPAVACFMPTGTDTKYYRFLGARDVSPTNMFEFATGNDTYRNARLYLNFGTASSTAYTSNTNDYFKNKKIVAVKNNNVMTAYVNNSQVGDIITGTTDTSFTVTHDLRIFHSNGTGDVYIFIGRGYYVLLGGSSFVPAQVGTRVGMYDTYNDVFYPSETATPFIAGPRIPSVTDYFRNKKIAIIGDSISTYDQDGYKYDSYRMYYPAGDVDTVDETWWKRLMDTENCTLDVNLAYSGSFSSNYNQNYPTFYDRTGLITDAEVIIVAIGTNDSSNSVPLGNFDYTTVPSNLDMSKFRESYIKGIRSLMTLYPSASIVCAIFSMGSDYRESIKTIAEHYGLDVVDCGNDYEKYTTVHPNANGMIQIYSNFLYI